MFSGPRERRHLFKIIFFFVNKIFLKQSVYVLYIRCKLYAAAVISLRFIVTVYYYIVYMYIPILLKILCIH